MSTTVCYLYDGSWDGLLSAVFTAYARKQRPEAVLPEQDAQLKFGQESVRIDSDPVLAQRVEKGIIRKLGSPFLQSMGVAFLSQDVDKGTIIYNYIRAGLEMGRAIYNALAHKDVLEMDRICLHIYRESHLLKGFVRFSLMENGVYFGRITPKNSVVPLLMPHFADRFSDQPFLLFDAVHHLAGVYDTRDWRLVETQLLDLPELAEEELTYRKLWKQFYHSVTIQERVNPTCQRNHMPKRYWGNMTEFMADKAR